MNRRRVVLLVDDDADIAGAVRDLVATVGRDIDVRVATDADAALAILREERVDLVMSDFRMPGMSGVDLLREARALAPATPRVLFTAYPDPAVATRAFDEAGAAFFVPKMADPEAIARVIGSALDGRPIGQGAVARGFSSSKPVRNPALP